MQNNLLNRHRPTQHSATFHVLGGLGAARAPEYVKYHYIPKGSAKAAVSRDFHDFLGFRVAFPERVSATFPVLGGLGAARPGPAPGDAVPRLKLKVGGGVGR